VIFYNSRKLNEHEENYVTRDLEMATIIHALKIWRHYLLGRKFVLMTDHSGLRYLFDQPKLNAIQARWIDLLSEFDFEIEHIKGKENRVVDTLNRSMKVFHLAAISTCESDIKERVKSVGIYYIPWKVIISLYYIKSCPQSCVKEYKTKISYLLWNSLLLVGILYKEMIKRRIILSHVQYVRVIPPYLLVYNNSKSDWSIFYEKNEMNTDYYQML
jgi:hypothetical protein